MGRPRLALPVTYQFTVRYLLHTGMLARLCEVADPVVMISWHDPELTAAFEASGAEVHTLVTPRTDPPYVAVRQRLDLLHQRRLASPTSAIDWRRRDARLPHALVMRRRARRALTAASFSMPGSVARLLSEEARLLHSETNIAEAQAQVEALDLDAVMTMTPFHHQEDLFLRAAARCDLTSICSLISFDNPTTRGWVPVVSDRYLVWNVHMVEQLRRTYPQLGAPQLRVTGAPQFDFYEGDAWRWSEQRWRETLALPAARPVILFGGGPAEIVAHEQTYLADLDRAITEGELPGNPIILFRRHPGDEAGRWQELLGRAEHIVVDEPWAVRRGDPATSHATAADIERFVSTLAHCAVHVSTSSTLSVDGAFLDRPQVSPAYAATSERGARRVVAGLYEREHWLPIAASGGLVVAHDRRQMISAVADGLLRPDANRAGRRRLVEEIVTHRDGRSTVRVVAEVADVLGTRPT